MLRFGLLCLTTAAISLVPLSAQNSTRATAIPGVVAADASVELVKEGFKFLEGPNGTPDGGLYFSDLQDKKVYRLESNGTFAVVRDNSNTANGLALDRDGSVLAAEHDTKRVTRMDRLGAVTDVVTTDPDGQPLLRPNDVIVDGRGGAYFSDPGQWPNNPGKAFLYYVRPDGKLVMISDELKAPNGLVLTLDRRVLLAGETEKHEVFAFDLKPDGTAVSKTPRVFAHLENIDADKFSYGDGMALDSDGRVYIATTPGIQVFDPAGKYLGTIPVPRQASSVAFGGTDGHTLYITARQGLYRVKMLSKAPNRPGMK